MQKLTEVYWNLHRSVAMAVKVVLWVMMMFMVCSMSKATTLSLSAEEDLALENQLKLLNKPSILTYQTDEGDIIDCIDIDKQPAFDHPLLKNHKLQTRPSMYPESETKKSSSKSKPSVFKDNRKPCPSGTVPIRRTSKEDLLRVKSMSKPTLNVNAHPVSFPFDQFVVSLSMKVKQPYYGAIAKISVYNLSVAEDQSSSTNMWVIGGPPQELNVILAGWQVNPAVNGDGLTRMFVYWTADGSMNTGCYNMLCQGFVQIDHRLTPDFPLQPTSYDGADQYDMKFYLFQDRSTGNWWLAFTESGTPMGYWPKELFPHLSNGADQVAWGGIAKAGKNGISPPMGSGNLPNGNFRQACYFRNINYVDDQNKGQFPGDDIEEYVGDPKCYGLLNQKDCWFKQLYYCFTFGGPGGQCGV